MWPEFDFSLLWCNPDQIFSVWTATQLGGIMTLLFQLLLDPGFVPHSWKESTVIPIPKISSAKVPKDYRPVPLTSVLCKCMERVVCGLLSSSVAEKLELQFAYKAQRGVEDAFLTLLDTITHAPRFYSWTFPQPSTQSRLRQPPHWTTGQYDIGKLDQRFPMRQTSTCNSKWQIITQYCVKHGGPTGMCFISNPVLRLHKQHNMQHGQYDTP